MKRTVISVILLVIAAPVATAADFAAIEEKIERISEQIQQQVEQIQDEREKADAVMELATERAEEDLKRSEEKLAAQIELLNSYQDDLAARLDDATNTLVQYQERVKTNVTLAVSQVSSQIAETRKLMSRLQTLRSRMKGISQGMEQTGGTAVEPYESAPEPCPGPNGVRSARAASTPNDQTPDPQPSQQAPQQPAPGQGGTNHAPPAPPPNR
jgi:alanyl-tRNA synthetase